MDLFWDQKGIDFPTKWWRRNSFDKNYPMQEHHMTCKATVRLRHYSFDKNYPMQEHHTTCKATVRLRRNSFDKNYPMQEHYMTYKATVRLGHNSFDMNYPMKEQHTTRQATKEDTHTWEWTKRLRNEADSTKHKRRSWEHETITNIILRITFSRPTNIVQIGLQPFTLSSPPKTTNDMIWECRTAKQSKHRPPPPPLRVLPRRYPPKHLPPLMRPCTGVHASTIGAICTWETKRERTGSQSNLDETNRADKRKRSTGVSQGASATNTMIWPSSSRNFKNEGRGWIKRWETSGTRTGATREDVWWPRSGQGKKGSKPDGGHTTTSNSRFEFDERWVRRQLWWKSLTVTANTRRPRDYPQPSKRTDTRTTGTRRMRTTPDSSRPKEQGEVPANETAGG